MIAWRKDLEARELADSSIRRKLAAVSSLFDYMCERNAVLGNLADGIKRPAANNNEGSTPALGDAQARKLLDAPPEDTLKATAIARSLPRCSLTESGVKNYVCCGFATCKPAKELSVFESKVSATRFASCQSTLRLSGSLRITWV